MTTRSSKPNPENNQEKPDDIVYNDPSIQFRNANLQDAHGLMEPPANLRISTATDEALVDVAKLRGMDVLRVATVRAARRKGETKVYIYPVPSTDPAAIQVKRYRGRTYINLRSLLGLTEHELEPGYRVKYALKFAGTPDAEPEYQTSPVGEALAFDLAKPVERRIIEKKSRSKKQSKEEPKNAPEKK